MKNIRSFMLLFMTSLASILSGCGGGGSTVTDATKIQPEDNTTEEIALFKQLNVGFGGSYVIQFTSDANESQPIYVSTLDLLLDEDVGSNSTYQGIKNFDANAFNALHIDLQGT